MIGCDRQADDKWYRMLRPDGKPMLKGWSPSSEMEQAATSSADGGAFALGVVKATRAMSRGAAFQTSDLESERISVYREVDGQRLLAFRIAGPVPTKQTFELSPQGKQLVVLVGDQISLYSVPAGSK